MTINRFFKNTVAAIAIVSGGLLLHSCGKEKDVIPSPSYSIATNFVGGFVGISSCDTGVASIVINAGMDRTKVTLPAFFGTGDCKLITTINATVAGNTMTIPYTEYQDLCFGDYSVEGTATLVNDSIFLTVNATTPLGNSTCSFMGRKIADTTSNVQ